MKSTGNRLWLTLRSRLPAVLLAVLIALLSGSAAGEGVKITEDARKHFHTALQLLKDPLGPRYEDAYRSFIAAYKSSPTPQILGNLGHCAMMLERDGEAIEAYERYLAEVIDVGEVERKQIDRDLGILKASAVPVELHLSIAGAKLVDTRIPVQGQPVVNHYPAAERILKLRIRAGHHRFEIRREGYEPVTRELDAIPGEHRKLEIELVEKKKEDEKNKPGPDERLGEPAESRPTPAGVYVGVAITGALAAAAVVTGILTLQRRDEFDKVNNGADQASAEELREEGVALGITTDVLISGAALGAVVTAIVFFTRPSVMAEPEATGLIHLAPAIGPGSGGLMLSGTF